jgi:hypothetical protein
MQIEPTNCCPAYPSTRGSFVVETFCKPPASAGTREAESPLLHRIRQRLLLAAICGVRAWRAPWHGPETGVRLGKLDGVADLAESAEEASAGPRDAPG